jgi:hypothetical protein
MLFAQSLAFAVPGELVQSLMQAPEKRYVKERAVNSLDADIEAQLGRVQERLARELKSAAAGPPLVMGGYAFARLPPYLKCWRVSRDGNKQRWLELEEICYLDNASMITDTAYAGTMRLSRQVVANKKLNDWQFHSVLAAGFRNEAVGAYTEEQTTKFDCDELDLVNANAVAMRVAYCVNAFVRMPGLYDLDFRLVTLGGGAAAAMVSGYLSGFRRDALQELLRLTVDGVRPG